MENYKRIFDQDKLEEILKNEMKPNVESILKQSEERMPRIIESTITRIFQAPEIDSLLVALVKAGEDSSGSTKMAELERIMNKLEGILKKECEEAGKAFGEVLTQASVDALTKIINEHKY